MFRGRSGKTGRGGQAAHRGEARRVAANIAKLPELLRGEGRRPINSGRLLHRRGITPVGAPRRKPAIAPSPRPFIGVVRYVAWWNTQCNVFVGIMRAQRIEQTKSDDAPILKLCTCHNVPPSSIGGSAISLSVTGGAQTFVVPMIAGILRLIRPWSLRKRPHAEAQGQGSMPLQATRFVSAGEQSPRKRPRCLTAGPSRRRMLCARA
jgi:hypothetical protein